MTRHIWDNMKLVKLGGPATIVRVGVLEDLIVAAVNDARMKADSISQERMAELTSGLPLPPGMKLPF